MTKFVTTVIGVAFFVAVFGAAALAEGWKIGNWEPPTKAPMVKAVSLNADWGTPAVVAPAGCSGMVQHSHAAPAMRAGCSGSGRFVGWRIRANRQARARARMGSVMVTGHS